LYEYSLDFLGNNIRLWPEGGPNGIKRRWLWESHNHSDYELHVLLAGEAHVDVEGVIYRLEKHQAIVVAPGMYHCRLPEGGRIERFGLNFSVADGPLLWSLRERVRQCGVVSVGAEVLSACRSIDSELSSQKTFHRAMVQGHLTRILVSVFRQLQVECTTEKSGGKRIRELDTHEVDLFFESHIKDGGKLEELAAKLYLSKGQLNRLLREKYGMTFREKLLRARMGQAARLLRYTDMPVFRIAEEVGYTATSSFYHVFRDWHGMTPEHYRRQSRPGGEPEEE